MKPIIIMAALLSLDLSAKNHPALARFFHALHQVEASGRKGPIKGDNGKALGPLQIHLDYWKDAGVPGQYSDCADLAYSKRVVLAYLKRYAPAALKAGDWEILARIHNGGPRGHRRKATVQYWRKVKEAMK